MQLIYTYSYGKLVDGGGLYFSSEVLEKEYVFDTGVKILMASGFTYQQFKSESIFTNVKEQL